MKNENKKIALLIKQIRRGNQSAFEEFYKLTSSKAYFIALKITQNEQDAEDILQESYIKALEKINEIDTSQNINSWFLKIVANKSKDLLKSKNRLVFDGEEDNSFIEIPEEKAEFSPEENLNQEELRLEVMAAIDELTEEKRACIMMMYFGDMSVKEIAESIEVPESTVKNRLYTARKDLRTKFEKNGNILYGAAIGGVLVWALNRTSVTAYAGFAASAASAKILSGIGASGAASSTAAVATGTGIAAKAAALSVAQKVVIGVTAASVIGGGTAGVVSIVNTEPETTSLSTTAYTEQTSSVPSQTTEYVFVEFTTAASTTEVSESEKSTVKQTTVTRTEQTTQKREPTATTSAVSESKTPVTEDNREESSVSVTSESRTRPTTTRRDYSLYTSSTTAVSTTTVPFTTEETTTRRQRTTTTTEVTSTQTTRQTTTETETEEETTHTTTQTTTETTTEPTTVTTTEPTTEPTTESTTQAPATVNVEVVDMNEDVVATFSFTVEAGTEMTWEYLVTQIKAKGYEPMAGIYGDAVDAVAESGTFYTITAEL